MNIEQAKQLLERNGYSVSPPVNKDAMLTLMVRLHDWYADGYDGELHESDDRCYDAIIELIKEHVA